MTEVRKHRRRTASGKTTTVRQHHREGGDGGGTERPERFLLTVRSRSGKRINAITGAPEDTIMVHGREDLERRLRAAEQDPDIEVSYRDDRAPAPHVSSLTAGEQPEPDWSWLDGEDQAPAGDFWADDEPEDAEPEPPRWRDLTREERRAAVAEYKAADEALHANGEAEKAAGIEHETDRFHELNDAMWAAHKKVPWWRRWR